jgi:hypothetical protein
MASVNSVRMDVNIPYPVLGAKSICRITVNPNKEEGSICLFLSGLLK